MLKEGREIDIVISNEKRMTQFLKLIIYKIQTIDGTRDSAVKLKEVIFN